jgi:hypothetical protein
LALESPPSAKPSEGFYFANFSCSSYEILRDRKPILRSFGKVICQYLSDSYLRFKLTFRSNLEFTPDRGPSFETDMPFKKLPPYGLLRIRKHFTFKRTERCIVLTFGPQFIHYNESSCPKRLEAKKVNILVRIIIAENSRSRS